MSVKLRVLGKKTTTPRFEFIHERAPIGFSLSLLRAAASRSPRACALRKRFPLHPIAHRFVKDA